MNARRIGFAIVAVGATLLTCACAAGQHAMTAEEVPTIDGQNADLGKLAIRDISVQAPVGNSYRIGADAKLTFVVVNNGQSDDELTGVTSSAFTASALYDSPAAAAGDIVATLPIKAGESISVGISQTSGGAALTGLTTAAAGADDGLFPGESIPLTFTFSNAGSVTAQVPVALRSTPNTASVSAPSGAAQGE